LELGCIAAIDSDGRTIFIVDAHRDNGKRFVAHADEKVTAFLELEAAISTQMPNGPDIVLSRVATNTDKR
jgi:hypothetical protein